MERVTYILGAGFSAPAGLPVMANFVSKAKDLYFSDPEKFRYFKRVFNHIDDMSKIKNYFDSDLFNIEEVLSILETERQTRNATQDSEEFISFICDVVNQYTPNIDTFKPNFAANWDDLVFGRSEPQKLYSRFFSSLFELKLHYQRDSLPVRGSLPVRVEPYTGNVTYSAITLNYDLLPERFEQIMAEFFQQGETIFFEREKWEVNNRRPCLVKLHGSADKGDIIPPTWAKSASSEIRKSWQFARQILENSNHIRIIGYSLPITDSYITYLLKLSMLKNQHLKSIDVMCLDQAGEVKNRYDNFITFNNYRFFNVDVLDYFRALTGPSNVSQPSSITTANLEAVHRKFLSDHR